jgi:nucleoside-diphosphate-sugar epimerase
MNILIIGGSGHVSGAVARAALAGDHQVWTVTRGQRATLDGVTALIADRKDTAALTQTIADENMTWDLVVDCICYDTPDMEQDIAIFRERARQFVLVSTDFVYDPARRKFPQTTDAPCVTSGDGSLAYGAKKRQCELMLAEADTGDMEWTVVRPCHIYGPTSELGCLPLHGRDKNIIETLRNGEPIQLVGGGHFLQQPILADDLAKTILSIAGNHNANGRIFNTAGPEIIESREFYKIVADIVGGELIVKEISVESYLADNPGHAPFLCHRIYDIAPLAEAGLHIPATPVAEGLRLHVEGLLARRKAECSG